MSEPTVIEIAKAAQETAKAVQSVAALADKTGSFVGKLVGPGWEALGGMLGDQCKEFRASNLGRIAQKWEKIASERNINPDIIKHLPFGMAYRTLEIASMEDNESVQELWAELLASATNPDRDVEVKKVYIDILKSVSAVEAALLNLLWEIDNGGKTLKYDELRLFEERINELAKNSWRGFSKSDRDTAVQNLVRLRCITYRPQAPHINNLFDAPRLLDKPWPRDCGLVNVKKFEQLMKYFEDTIMISAGIKEFPTSNGVQVTRGFFGGGMTLNIPELNYLLTPIGKDLLYACKDENLRNRST